MLKSEPRIITEKQQEHDFTAHATMEDLLDKLHLLNYESEFLSTLKMKPIHRYYFVVTKNPGEQFYLFSVLAAWLARKCGKNFEQPQEYDDPNETISKILNVCKELDITGEHHSSQLKQGVGDSVVQILNSLATEALKKNGFMWHKPKPPEDKEEEAEIIDDESEINLDRVEEEMIAAYSDDSDEENIFRLDQLKVTPKERHAIDLTAKVDEEAWKLEVERVLPQLKVTIRNDNRDWRSHLEQMKQYKMNIDEALVPVKNQLERLHKEISSTLEKVGNREKYLNRELEGILDEYRILQDQLSKIKDKYKNISGGVSERNRELAKMSDKLESLKQQMEERGSSMTDGTPLVNIKKAVTKIKAEITEMDVRIGVLDCMLLQGKIREEKQLEDEFGQTISVY